MVPGLFTSSVLVLIVYSEIQTLQLRLDKFPELLFSGEMIVILSPFEGLKTE